MTTFVYCIAIDSFAPIGAIEAGREQILHLGNYFILYVTSDIHIFGMACKSTVGADCL